MLADLKQQSDENLVIYYQSSNDKFAVGELYKRHSLMCFAVCNKYLKNKDAAQDAAMCIFEKLFTDLHKHSVQNFKSWLHSICRNYCLMQLRKTNFTISLAEPDNNDEEDFMESDNFLHQENSTHEKEYRLQELEKAIDTLKDGQKVCIELFYLKQKSYEQISEITGFSLNVVKSQIQNGKRNLKISLNQKGINLAIAILLWIQQHA